MLFKICNVERERRKIAIAENMEELLKKAVTLLRLDCSHEELKIVTSDDGYDVDDDETLAELKSQALMILMKHQNWNAPAVETPDQNSHAQDPAGTSTEVPTYMESVASCRADKHTSAENIPSTSSAHHHVELPLSAKPPKKIFTVPLPVLSSFVHDNMENGKVLNCFNNLVSECAHFYINRHPISSSSEYREVGEQLFMKYPALKFPKGNEPWTLFCDKLSQKIRNIRFQQKRKSQDCETQKKSPKRPAFTTTTTSAICEISEEDYNSHVEQIKLEMQKTSPNKNHLQLLLKESFLNRRKWLSTLPSGSWSPLIERFQCFEDIEHVIYEYRLIKNLEDIDQEVGKMEKVFKTVAKHARGGTIQGTDLQKEIELILLLEKLTAFDKGKGKKTESILTLKKDIAEDDIENNCSSKEASAPKLLCFISNNKLQEAVIVGDSQKIFCRTDSLLQGLLYLVLLYYVTDLDYPRQFSQLLGIVQQYVLGDAFNGAVSGKFVKFCHFIETEMAK